jgi:hypothetical protein
MYKKFDTLKKIKFLENFHAIELPIAESGPEVNL